ncbi:MAG TPA: alpha/beta hydrolase [Chloroflexota bacterium]|nr:alpha/beta hydrolase [Chloroflexota bacterium]
MELRDLPTLQEHESVIEGISTRWVTGGQGEPVVFLHGWGGEVASFGPILARLVTQCQIIALDLPGFGRTSPPPVPWGSFDYARFFRSFLRELGINSATLIGHSFGGKVGLIVAAQVPDLVRKLVLVDSAGIRPRRGPSYYARVSFVKAARSLLALPVLRLVRKPIMRRVYQMAGSSDYNAAMNPIIRATLVKVVNEDVRTLLPRIKVPTLLVWGDQDADTPLSDGRLMEKLIPDAGLVVFEGAGHFAYLDRLDQFCRVVAHFIEH